MATIIRNLVRHVSTWLFVLYWWGANFRRAYVRSVNHKAKNMLIICRIITSLFPFIKLQANKCRQVYYWYNSVTLLTSSYMYVFRGSVTHHQEAIQVVRRDCLLHWCLECRTAEKSARWNMYRVESQCAYSARYIYTYICIYTGCFATLGHNCRRWFPRSLWSKKFI